jgi:hypothetical protein
MRMRMLIEDVMVIGANINSEYRSRPLGRSSEHSFAVNIGRCHGETYRPLSRRSEEPKIRSCPFASAAAGSAGRQHAQESQIQTACDSGAAWICDSWTS